MTPRRRVVSDPREIAGMVLETPGMLDRLADALTRVDILSRAFLRTTLARSLVEIADAWPEGDRGWAIDNDGEPYPYDRKGGK